MQVKDIMTKNVKTCHIGDSVEATAVQMKKYDSGFIPVVDEQNHVTGVITDRDIVMCSVSNDKALWDIKSQDITKNRPLYSCKPGDNVRVALETMRTRQLHRLPVIDEQGKIKGVLGLGDIIENTVQGNVNQISPDETLNTLKGVFAHR